MCHQNISLDWATIWEHRGNSYNEACRKLPNARREEHSLFIRDLDIQSGQTFLDVAAGGGEVSNVIFERFGENINIIAIEPSQSFALGLNPSIQHLSCSLTSFTIADATIDASANFACLHHVPESHLVINECFRVLKKSGTMGIADVCQGSSVDVWLNVFVDNYNSQGHKGFFFREGELSDKIQAAGFASVCERRVQYTWDFNTVEEMVWYCQTLFGIDLATPDQIHDGIDEILGYVVTPANKVQMNWELIHAFGIK